MRDGTTLILRRMITYRGRMYYHVLYRTDTSVPTRGNRRGKTLRGEPKYGLTYPTWYMARL